METFIEKVIDFYSCTFAYHTYIYKKKVFSGKY